MTGRLQGRRAGGCRLQGRRRGCRCRGRCREWQSKETVASRYMSVKESRRRRWDGRQIWGRRPLTSRPQTIGFGVCWFMWSWLGWLQVRRIRLPLIQIRRTGLNCCLSIQVSCQACFLLRSVLEHLVLWTASPRNYLHDFMLGLRAASDLDLDRC